MTDSLLNSSVSELVPGSNRSVYRARALHAYTSSAEDPTKVSFANCEALDTSNNEEKWWKSGSVVSATPSDHLQLPQSASDGAGPSTHNPKITDNRSSHELIEPTTRSMSSGSICNESAIGLPLMVSGNSSISTSGRSPPMNSGVPGLVLGSNELVYRAKALHAYTASAEDPTEVSFAKYEVLDILDKEGKWWQVKKSDGTIGIAPSNYLQLLCLTDNGVSPSIDNPSNTAYRAKALYNYTGSAEDPAEISFAKYEVLDVLGNEGKWWHVRKADGTLGIAPSNYLELLHPASDGTSPSIYDPGITSNRNSHGPIELTASSMSGGSTCSESTIDFPLIDSGDPSINTGRGSPPMNSSGSVYRARALHTYAGSAEDPTKVPFAKHEVLDVLDKRGKWWQVKKSNGTVGIAPSKYLQLLCLTGKGTDTAIHNPNSPVYRAKALYTYAGSTGDPTEISFVKYEVLDVLDNEGMWWWVKKSDGAVGIAPSNYLQLL